MMTSTYHKFDAVPLNDAPAKPEGSVTLEEWFEYGRRSFHRPDGAEAVAAMRRVTEMNPGYRHPDGDNPYFYIGKIHEVENRLDQAIVAYTRALAVDPRDEDSLVGRGTCYTLTHRHAAAIYDFTRLLRFPRQLRSVPDKQVYFMLSENARKAERWADAIFWGALAKDADPGDEQQRMIYNAMLEKADDRRFVE